VEPAAAIRARVAALDFAPLAAELERAGFARIPALLDPASCSQLAALYAEGWRFRKRVEMERQRFGAGEYQYFSAPLPAAVAALRSALYPGLAHISNAWQERLRTARRFPPTLAQFLRECADAGQLQPTPLLLRYRAGGYNRLHQDLYGEITFPLQLAVLLSRPGVDFDGGEFLLLEQRARMQSRGEAIALAQGEGLVFPTRERPVPGPRGDARAQLRHGISSVRSGERLALGVIFHDARS
jgi:hypothetical protein